MLIGMTLVQFSTKCSLQTAYRGHAKLLDHNLMFIETSVTVAQLLLSNQLQSVADPLPSSNVPYVVMQCRVSRHLVVCHSCLCGSSPHCQLCILLGTRDQQVLSQIVSL
jgi:hypothetical protein